MSKYTYENFLSLIKSIKIELPRFEMPELRMQELAAPVPIVQGGMGVGISLSGLASAVARAGGVGLIAANGIGMIEPDYFKDGRAANIRALRKEIRKARAAGDGLIGVNIMVALNDFKELLETAVEEKVDMVVMGAGLPIKNIPVEEIRRQGVKVVPIVSSSRAADLIFKMWKRMYKDVPDAVVVEGPEAGGHLGVAEEEIHDEALKIEHVVPEVRAALAVYEEEFGKEIPVIAAGGIFTGEDIYRIMKLGASGVQMGTRFVATEECDADVRFKQAYVGAGREDIGIIKSPVGLPGRAIINGFLTKAAESRRTFKCPWQCLAGCQADKAHYCISLALNNARQGKLEQGFVFVGSNAWRVESIVPVKQLVDELEAGYMKALFADMKGILAGLIERIHELKKEYRRLETSAARLKKEYEAALTAKIRSVGNTGASALREEYRRVSARLTELQLNMTERVYDAFEILMKGTRA